MNNWHIKIADCNEAQKERLKQVYGFTAIKAPFFGMKDECICEWVSPRGELITPDEAFERLGLTAKPELQGIDWALIDSDFTHLVQDKETGRMKFCRSRYYSDCKELYHLIATRPKPKYTPEQIEAVKDFDAWVSRRHKLSGEFNWWLKEVGNG